MQSPDRGTPGILRLPREVRDEIYKRVLVISSPLHLFAEGEASDKVEVFAPGKPAQWLALLHTNRQLHSEASETLYGSHKFVMVDTTSAQAKLLKSFLDKIGRLNAGYVTSLCINFPTAEPGQSMSILRERCSSLRTLELFVHNKNSQGLVASSYEASKLESIRGLLLQVNAQFAAMPSVQNVLVKLYHGPLAPEVSELMRGFGWTVEVGR
ncbi:hypothetical protein B0T16DRAFT_381231 [Cercophora newfieldiana]|uniref:Uncharacterized protein n=1 Tax=Cercophora newfieldiana TaxID=92897 RepID=A0AA40CKQ9_9PEZI|nr:hypothetical protein B0T16DRAFT_381231 [Cercophora newfieldiana]